MVNNEKIMVCVYYGPNGERLIRRGGELASLLHCPLYVLSVIPLRENELDQDQEQYIAEWKMQCEAIGATFITQSDNQRKASQIIAETAAVHQITQLIIGQTCKTRWQEIRQGSFVNELLKQIGETDLHIVAVQRIDNRLIDTHERGIRVSILQKDSDYIINNNVDSKSQSVAEGLFFKELNTDFDTGLLKISVRDGHKYVKVHHGKILDSSMIQALINQNPN